MTMVQIGSSAAPWRALFWASLVLLTACAGDPRDGGGALDAPILTALVARSPEAASWLERAAAAPAVSVGRGADRVFRVSTAHRAEPSPSTARPAGRFRSTERSVTVEIADDGSGAMRVSVAGCPLRVGVRRVGGVGAEAHLEGGAVALRGASPGVDALVFAKEHSVEDLLAAQGPEVSIGYELDLPEGWSLYRPQGFEGLVEIHDAQEIAWLRLWARKGWDRAGREVGIEPVVEGNRVRIRVEEGAEWPVLVDPEFEGTGSMAVLRVDHTATLIANGKVLVAGGRGPASAVLASAELYDPWTQTFTSSKGMMTTPRAWHTATPVPDGRVILAGGWDLPIDAYDSANDTFLPAGQTKFDMLDGTARLLFDGRVLLAGENGLQVYDPSSNIVSLQVTPLLSAHHYTSTRLRNGKVLVIGAWYGGAKPQPKPGPEPYDVPALTQLYDPVTDTSSAAVVIPELHWSSSATLLPNGKVLIVGPSTTFGGDPPPPSAVLYDPDSGEFNLVGTNLLAQSAATLLPDGTVLLLGGQVAQLFDPEGNFKEGGTLAEHRDGATATLLLDGSVLLTGGMDAGQKWLASAELYDATAGSRVKTSKTQRSYQGHTATPLGDGSVLLAGGIDAGDTPVSAAQLYHPMSGQFENAGHLHHVRYDHTATLLPNGEVLFVGGDFPSGGAPSAEVYDPLTKESSDVGALTAGALGHTATPLPSGKVLLAGGTDNQSLQSSLDLYDPATGAFSSAGTMPHPRSAHSATLLPNGKVLFASRSGVDVYDPSTSTWTPSGPMAAPRSDHTAVLLPDGKILFAGGGYTTI
ncbi:MAG: kelch repeat-containing protein, partial [Minicystis sp.]